jgi:hypothetical protein
LGRRSGRTDNENGYNVLFLSTNPEVGLQNLLAERVAIDLVETVNIPSVPVGYGTPAGLRMVYRPSEIASGRAILDRGGDEPWKPTG